MYLFNKTRTPTDRGAAQRKLHLRLTGFSQRPYLSIDEVVRAIDVLPSFHLEGLREISYLTELEAAQELADVSGDAQVHRKGAFIQSERRIVIYGFDNRALFYQVLYHEIGHYVFYLIISSTLKKHWVTQTHPGSVCITPYAASSASEDFAETYACYVQDPERLKQIPEKYSFMHHLVFSGDPITLKEKQAYP